jgi:hypothetical protein
MHPDYAMDPAKLEEEELDDEMDESSSSDDACSPYRSHFFAAADLLDEELEDEEDDEEDEEVDASSAVHPCAVCQALFTAKRDLRHHVRSKHHAVCAWTCRNCGAVFADAELFKAHLVKVHKLGKETFALDDPEQNPLMRPCLTIPQDVRPCPECQAEFASQTSLNLHRLRRHISKRLTQNV